MVALDDPRVRRYIQDEVGEEGLRLADILAEKGDATDVEIAEVLGAKPSHVRKILYDLYEARAAEYRKEKDKETGWLTFHWGMTPDQALYAVDQKVRREIGDLENRLRANEGVQFYSCPRGDARFEFTQAAEAEFRCPNHGDLLVAHDNRGEIEAMRLRLRELMAYRERLASAP